MRPTPTQSCRLLSPGLAVRLHGLLQRFPGKAGHRGVGLGPGPGESGVKPGPCIRALLGAASTAAVTTAASAAISPAPSAVSSAEPASPAAAFAGTTVIVAVVFVVVATHVAAVVAARGATSGGASTTSAAPARVQEDAYEDYYHDYRCNCQERPHRESSRAGSPDMGFSLQLSAPALQPLMQSGELDSRSSSEHECRFAGVVY